MSEALSWTQFKSSEQTPLFIDAAFTLYLDVLKNLNESEIPYFFDWWLNRLNLSDVWMLSRGPQVLALLSKPKVKDTHSERWQYNTLVVDPHFSDAVDLPFEAVKPIAFTVPYAQPTKCFDGAFAASYFQRGFARTSDNLPRIQSISGVTFEPVTRDNLDTVCALFNSGYDWDGQPADYIQSVKTEIARSVNLHSGWCYTATINSSPIAVVSYLPLQAPLLGTTSVLVGDLLVLPEYRGKGIATNLQLFAYHRFKAAGIRWILGNIDPANMILPR